MDEDLASALFENLDANKDNTISKQEFIDGFFWFGSYLQRHVHIPVCMPACMPACMHVYMPACMPAWMLSCIRVRTCVRLHACMYACELI